MTFMSCVYHRQNLSEGKRKRSPFMVVLYLTGGYDKKKDKPHLCDVNLHSTLHLMCKLGKDGRCGGLMVVGMGELLRHPAD